MRELLQGGLGALLLSIIFISTPWRAAAEDVAAEPIIKRAPDYPASCMPDAGAQVKDETIVVEFMIDEDGRTQSVRVRESTNDCFNEASVAAVRSWSFTPRKINGRASPQEDMEATFVFELEEETQAQIFDARPKVRVPPDYPDKCMDHAAKSESFTVKFDVNEDGNTENVTAVQSTDKCFEYEAVRAVKKWIYYPKLVNGELVRRKGVVTEIRFVLSDDDSGRDEFRREVYVVLVRIDRRLNKGKMSPHEALSELAKIEEEFGDSFSPTETAAFSQRRARARLAVGDYAGALDDLRTARNSGALAPESMEQISQLIAQLEGALAGQQGAEQ